MKLTFWLAALSLLFFSGCVGTGGTLKSAIPNDLIDANFCGQGLWGNWLNYSLLGGLIGFFVVAFVYMVGELAQKPDLVVGAKDDFYQTVVSMVIVANVVWMTGAMCSEVGPQLLGVIPVSGQSGVSGLYAVSFSYLNWLNSELVYGYLQVFIIHWRAALATSFVDGASPGGIGVNLSPMGGLGSLVSGLSMMLNALTIAWITNLVQIEVLKFVMLTSLTVFLPLGVVCRCFKPTRRFGGALMAMGIGLFFFYPIEISINAAVAQDYVQLLSDDIAKRGKCSSAADCCSSAPNACQSSPFPPDPSLGKLGGDTCDADRECYSRKCIGGKNDRTNAGRCENKGWCKACLVSGKLNESSTGTYDASQCCTNQAVTIPASQGGGIACKSCSVVGEGCKTDADCCAFKGGSQTGICEGVTSCSSDADCDSGKCDTSTNPSTGQPFNTCIGLCSDRYSCEFDIGVGQDSASAISGNTRGLAMTALLSNILPVVLANLLRVPFLTSGIFMVGWSAGIVAVLGISWVVFDRLMSFAVSLFVTAFILPTINLILIINIVRDLSKFLGEEMDISNLTRMI